MNFEFIRTRIGDLSDPFVWLHDWLQALETVREYIVAARKWIQVDVSAALNYAASHKYKITPVSVAYAVPIPTNTMDGDTGQIKIRGGSGSVTWGATTGDLKWDIADEAPPTLPSSTDDALLVSWTRDGNSFLLVSVVRNWE